MRRKKKKKNSKVFYITLVLFGLLLVILLILLSLNVIKGIGKPYYAVNSRVDDIKKNRKTDADDYRTIGWIQVQGTNIDVPVLRGVEGKFRYPVEVESYSWTISDDDSFHNKVNIYGHNLFNLGSSPKKGLENFTRFEDLMNFVYYDFAKENKYIQYTLGDKEYVYKIFAVSFISPVDVDMFPTGEYSDEEMEYHLGLIKNTNIYDYDIDVNEDDDLISVATCTRFFSSTSHTNIVVSGKLIGDKERINDYSVEKNKNYKKVEKILKGDDDNEEVGSA